MTNDFTSTRAVVTGGGGFVGKALCGALRARGVAVTSFSRRAYPELREMGAEAVQLDLANPPPHLADLLRGAEVIFHTAARVDMWGPYQDFVRNNIEATRSLLRAAVEAGVPYFVFTSSPSVVAHHGDLKGVDESIPYPDRYDAFYPQTKAAAEREVLAANGNGSLKTVALRPHLIWGPGDTHLVPTILEKARAGRLVQVGDGTNLVDVCFIEDCVASHLAAWNALKEGRAAGGRAYFISQGEPVPLWGWIGQILALQGVPPITRRVPTWLARTIATVCESYSKLHPRSPEPLFTRFLVSQMATHHYFDISAANRDLGFTPQWSVEDALRVTFGGASARSGSAQPQAKS